ncbi:hypothetical protein F5Y19DRAFT_492897 [Xylariaceae sp. FL1651]|nr:hypothetical protein F5Y19DRAFT_492897 [Xylariaceae sp. FL1651]
MVVGMTWPPRDIGRTNANGPPALEVIPPASSAGERPPKSRLIHGDLHARNIMIGELEPLEHRIVPILKLIDFGMSRDVPVRNNEIPGLIEKTNILAIGKVMLGLIGGHERGGPGMMDVTDKGQQKSINTYATDLDGLSNKYNAPRNIKALHQDKLANLDPEIRSLVALCVAVKAEDRPDIEYLLSEIERNVQEKTPQYYHGYKYQANESDEEMKRIVERYMLNA